MTFFLEWLHASWQMLTEAAPWLLAGFAIAGAIHVLIPTATLTRHLGRPGIFGAAKAALIGVPLPLCSCGVIPVASSLRNKGATRAATAGFLITTPETGVDSIALSYVLLGPYLAVARPVAALVTALTAAGLISATEEDTPQPQTTASDDVPCPSCCQQPPAPAPTGAQPSKFLSKAYEALHHAFIDMFTDLGHWLLLGFALAGLVTAALPDTFFQDHLGGGLGTMFLMILVATPLYVCATSTTPIAAALIAKGLSPGAALVLLLAGPATNLATMTVVAKELGVKALVIYVTSIAAVAVAAGLVTDHWFADMTTRIAADDTGHHTPSLAASFLAGLLVLLTINGTRNRFARKDT